MATADCAPDQQSCGEVKNAREIRHVLTEYQRQLREEPVDRAFIRGRVDALAWVLGVEDEIDILGDEAPR